MAKGWIDTVIRMYKPECKAEAKTWCMARAKEQLMTHSMTAEQYSDIIKYIKSR